MGGTGLFSSEYLVASKRVGRFDASLGLATGYIGNRGDFRNPLAAIDDHFETRPRAQGTGTLNSDGMFRGPVGVFGGVAYQTPWKPLQLKLEYDGNDYRHEPQRNNQRQRSPFNVGASYAVNRNLQLHLGWERGDLAMFGITLHSNLAQASSVPKLLDPPPLPLKQRDDSAIHTAEQAADTGNSPDWAGVARKLEDNAGLRVQRISQRGADVIVTGEQRRFYYPAQSVGRTARILDAEVPPSVSWVTVQNTRLGLPLVETSMERAAFADYLDNRTDLATLAGHVEMAPPAAQRSTTLYQAPQRRYEGAFNIGYQQSIGGRMDSYCSRSLGPTARTFT
ncbi:MAG: hypothetical protein GAK31_00637 [Stenotrophomonas maltophilia]|uniref:YjbH domain-containing protein n=1 Tax=Stenotrophomonas maltophilia TaxID=40324 RepID=A0A7V8FJX1_STEMA|nr:MAG: hypothetical protein GAK31_00637 [Stenotrophomonas maltophilia]